MAGIFVDANITISGIDLPITKISIYKNKYI